MLCHAMLCYAVLGTRIANRHVHGGAKLGGTVRLSEIVHQAAVGGGGVAAAGTRDCLSKKSARRGREAGRAEGD